MMQHLLYFLILSLLAGCAYNKADEEDLGPPVSYSQEVKPILVTHCYHCHTNAAIVGSSDRLWDKFENIQRVALAPSTVPPYSRLVAVLKHRESPFMPLDKTDPLPDSLVNIIHRWAKQGAPNN